MHDTDKGTAKGALSDATAGDNWKPEADRLLRLCQQQAQRIEELTPYVELFRRLDRRFGCDHTTRGAEDAEALLRHVDEVIDAATARADAAERERDRLREALEGLERLFRQLLGTWGEAADEFDKGRNYGMQVAECQVAKALHILGIEGATRRQPPAAGG